MDMSTPAAKRPRIDSAASHVENTTGIDIVRSKLWYQDGNVILQAGQTQFRVHRSILAQHSAVFSDMFSIGSSEGHDKVEGCDVVPVYDTDTDMDILLNAVYNPMRHFDTKRKLPFNVISAVVRLGKKYDVHELYRRAVELLTEEFPTVLSDWDSVTDDFRNIEYYDGLVFDIVWLAREANLVWVLPQALYCCSRKHGLESFFRGLPESDPPVQPLSPDDQLACIRGWDALCQESALLIARWSESFRTWNIPGRSGRCVNPSAPVCIHGTHRDVLLVIGKSASSSPTYQSRFQLVSEEWDYKGHFLCQHCKDMYRDKWGSWRLEIWEKLPSFFGFPSWSELRLQRDEQASDDGLRGVPSSVDMQG